MSVNVMSSSADLLGAIQQALAAGQYVVIAPAPPPQPTPVVQVEQKPQRREVSSRALPEPPEGADELHRKAWALYQIMQAGQRGVAVGPIAAWFEVTAETIRTDLRDLYLAGYVQRQGDRRGTRYYANEATELAYRRLVQQLG
jgi:hypothetical protein